LDYANQKATQINQKIAQALLNVAATNPRLKLVNIERALGNNALCSKEAETNLANGINQDVFDQEVDRLLNINGKGDIKARALANQVFIEYTNTKNVLEKTSNRFIHAI